MRGGPSWSKEIRNRNWGKLRTRRHGLPRWSKLHGFVGSSGALCVGGCEYRSTTGWAGNRFRIAGDEPEGGALPAEEQSKARSRCSGGSGTKGQKCHGRNRRCDESGDPVVLAI